MLLFKEIIYGPVRSRRLGCSLGLNVSPSDGKRCTFDCIYCECGLNAERPAYKSVPDAKETGEALRAKASQLLAECVVPDVFTFSGNGEPTMNPHFAEIIDAVIKIRNETFPKARVAVLSNSTMLHKDTVVAALMKADELIMKLDAAEERLVALIDRPAAKGFTAAKVIEQLRRLGEACGKLTVQTMFLRGEHCGEHIDNTTADAVAQWLAALKEIRPQKVMIYTISRETPVKSLQKVSEAELEAIAVQVRAEGFEVTVAGG
jgi:wyosine [tRNA(Phe)-imidazoG37] synthetase (radical SAM superfamily)